jgi:hypothetical protein
LVSVAISECRSPLRLPSALVVATSRRPGSGTSEYRMGHLRGLRTCRRIGRSRRPAWSGLAAGPREDVVADPAAEQKDAAKTATMRCGQDAEEFAAAACFAISLARSVA